jgi:hypothetical protein
MKRSRYIYVTVVLTLVGAGQAQAQLTNGSFESGLTGWTLSGNIGTLTSSFGKTPTAGTRMGYMVSQNSLITGVTTTAAGGSGTAQSTAAALATAMGTTTANLNTIAGAGHSVTTGAAATGGSGIFQSVSVSANSSLLFDFSFLTAEDPILRPTTNNNDFAFISINGNVTVLGRLDKLAADPLDKSAYEYIPFTGGAVDGTNIQTYLFETGAGGGSAALRTSNYNANTGTNFSATNFNRKFGVSFASAGTVNIGVGVINVHTTGATGSIPSALIIDNMRLLSGVVPEPSALALLGLGALGALSVLRRRNRF